MCRQGEYLAVSGLSLDLSASAMPTTPVATDGQRSAPNSSMNGYTSDQVFGFGVCSFPMSLTVGIEQTISKYLLIARIYMGHRD